MVVEEKCAANKNRQAGDFLVGWNNYEKVHIKAEPEKAKKMGFGFSFRAAPVGWKKPKTSWKRKLMALMNTFEKIYKELKREYGRPVGQWRLWCRRPKTKQEREEVIIGAVLTQRTNWKNVEQALTNLKKTKGNSLKSILRRGPKNLENLIKPSGFYKTKARYLFNLAKFILKNYKSLARMEKTGSIEELREELLKQKGIGPETADSILLYGLDKPIFVVDEYTRRLVKKRNLAKKMNYQFLQKLFEDNLKKDFKLYQDFHALIVINGKNQK